MVQFNAKEKELIIKLVYYGPGLSGKTTNLRYIHKATDPNRETKLISLNTEKDRTLFFDLLPYDLGNIRGMRIKMQLYTVPGQSKYSSTRKAVLKGADGVVFVADSQRYMMTSNIENLKDMAVNLRENKLDIDTVPLVMQYNKRDLPKILTVNELNNILNKRNCPYFEAIAINGDGVFETLTSVLFDTVDYVSKEFELPSVVDDIANIKRLIVKNLGRFSKSNIEEAIIIPDEEPKAQTEKEHVKQAIEEVPSEPSISFSLEDPLSVLDKLEKAYLNKEKSRQNPDTDSRNAGETSYEQHIDTDDLIMEPENAEKDAEDQESQEVDKELFEKAVDSNLQISQLYLQVEEITRKLNEKIEEISVLNQVSMLMSTREELPEILKRIFKFAMEAKHLHHGSLLVPKKDGYKQLIAVGFSSDPLNSLSLNSNNTALSEIISRKKIISASIINDPELSDIGIENQEFFKMLKDSKIDAFVVAPMISKGIMHGVFNFYRVESPYDFSTEDVEFLYSLATQAALVIENTKLKHRSESGSENDISKKIQNMQRLMLVFQKRLQANTKALEELGGYFASSSETRLELLVKNEKDLNNKILNTISEIIKNF